ncbi:MAG TPA: hypothetical protein VJR29_13855 [bacterium]|nr:hypothetical protein [bacterium]
MSYRLFQIAFVAAIAVATTTFTSAFGTTLTDAWSVAELPGFGVEGSPTYCDLDGDGQDEAIVPAAWPLPGFGDLSYMNVIDPATGTPVFTTPPGTAGFSHPICRDVNDDGTLDIITAGRFEDVYALSGVDGSRLWALTDQHPDAPMGNIYAPVGVPQHPDLLFVTTGGGGEQDVGGPRNPGGILAINTDGELLARWAEPNQAEVYSSAAVVAAGQDPRNILVVFGSGGETLPGSLHFLIYNRTFKKFVPIAEIPTACDSGGYIPSPVIGDITGGILHLPEVVAADMCGNVAAFTFWGHELWRRTITPRYIVSNPVLVNLDGKKGYDVVVAGSAFNFSLPETYFERESVVAAFRGKDGAPLWSATLDLPVTSSPVTADADGDGTEDIWVAHLLPGFTGPPDPSYLQVLSGKSGSPLLSYGNVNWAGTPVIGDADGDGSLDVLIQDAPADFGGTILESETRLISLDGVPFDPDASYSGFRGINHDGYRR